MAGGDSLVAHPRVCRPRSGRCRRKPGRRGPSVGRPARCVPCAAIDRPAAPGHGTLGAWSPARLPARSPTPPAPTSSSTPTAGSSTWARPSPCGSACPIYFQDPAELAAPDGPDGRPGRPRRVGGGGHRGRGAPPRAHPDQAAPAPLQRPAQGRQELSVAGRDRERRVAAARPWSGAASARASATSAPTPTSAPSATPSTCCCGQLPGADLLGHQVPAPPAPGPALPALPHRALLGPVRRARSTTTTYDGMVDDLMAFLGGDTEPSSSASSRRRCRRPPTRSSSSGPSVLRDKLEAVQGGRAVRQMELGPARGLRRGRAGRGRAGGRRAGVPRPVGQGGRATGASFVDKVEDLSPARVHASGSWSRSTPTAAPGCPGRCWCPTMPDDARR